MRRFFYLAACLLWVSQVDAASFDCAKAFTPVEQIICDDPALSQLDETLAATLAATMTATLDPQALLREQRRWLARRDSGATISGLPASYRDRIAALDAATELWRAWPHDLPAEQLRAVCIIPPDAPPALKCQVEEFGTIKSKGDQDTTRYQLQSYRDGDRRIGGGVVLFEDILDQQTFRETGRLAPIATAYAPGVRYARPQLVLSHVATWLLLPGRGDGSGEGGVESLFVRDPYHDARLRAVDTETWQGDLARRLPKGASLRKTIETDYLAMTATTALWQRSDADCCPTAGQAIVRLELDGERLVIAQIAFERGAPVAASDEKPRPTDAAAAAACAKSVTYEVDEKSFRDGPAANDREAIETARTMGPVLVRLALQVLCAKTELSPKEVARVSKVRIAYSDQANVFSAYLPDDRASAGVLVVRMAWMGAAVPSDEEARTGILCGFKRTLKQCAGWGP
jgi:uncharacterized protein